MSVRSDETAVEGRQRLAAGAQRQLVSAMLKSVAVVSAAITAAPWAITASSQAIMVEAIGWLMVRLEPSSVVVLKLLQPSSPTPIRPLQGQCDDVRASGMVPTSAHRPVGARQAGRRPPAALRLRLPPASSPASRDAGHEGRQELIAVGQHQLPVAAQKTVGGGQAAM